LLMAAPSWAQETYKIGGVFSVTGAQSFLGDPEKKSLEMAIDAINAKGGIDGHRLEAVIYDDEGDPTKAVNAATRLISKDNALAIIGPSLTPTTLAIIPVVEEAKVPTISCAAGIKITEPVKPWVFKTAQNDVLAVATIYKTMQDKKVKKLGVLTVANAFGESGKEQLLAQAPKFGMEIVANESFDAKDTDMTAQLTKIRKAEPDAIICWGTNPGPAVVAKNLRQLNMNTPLYQSHGVASGKFIELAGEAADGIMLPTGKILVATLLPETDSQRPALLNYIKDFESRYSMPVSGFGGYAYDAMGILEKAIQGSGGNRDKIRDGIEKLTGYVGVTGTFNFTPQDHNGLGSDAFVMVKINKGTWELLR
jgi:branched-chain amino acid transport system substrate-binding protein